jgi:HAD superfamily hydrolase (TIGR01490 family)
MILSEYLEFCLKPLSRYSLEELQYHHQQFMTHEIAPIVLPKAKQLLAKHRHQGDHLMIITATNRFITEPIADEFEVDTLLATELEIHNNRYTGKTVGTPTYQEGKVIRLQQWLDHHPEHSWSNSSFYSDSHNDLPLLERVDHPYAVDPDDTLRAVANERSFPVVSLR